MSYKALATDIDGTITDSLGRVHLEAVKVIRQLREKGIPVVLVSGRPLPIVESLAMYLGTDSPFVAENGAVARIGGEPVFFGGAEPAKEALSLLKQKLNPVLSDDNRYRLIDISLEKTIDPEAVQQVIGEARLPVTLLVTSVALHLVDQKVSKGKTLQEVLSHLGILPRETVVIGDSFNDLPLFGIGALNLTVANAEPVVQEKADRIARFEGGAGFAELVGEVF